MSRKKPTTLAPIERSQLLDEFWTMIALLKTKEEVKQFFKDLLSETEAIMLARRIQVAKLLLQHASYEEIRDKLGVSHATIAAVHRWLQGGFGGYEHALPRLSKELERQAKVRIKQARAK